MNSRNFYFRRSVSDEPRAIIKRREIWISLATPDREVAMTMLKRAASALTIPRLPAEQEFRGNLGELLAIDEAEIELGRKRRNRTRRNATASPLYFP